MPLQTNLEPLGSSLSSLADLAGRLGLEDLQARLSALLASVNFHPNYPATGVSSSQSPYLVPVDLNPASPHLDTHVAFTSIITAGDAVGLKDDGVTPWRFAGTPDGIGAFDNGDGTFTVLVNHEFTQTDGIVRDHGANGSFISELRIDKATLKVLEGKDLIEDVHVYDPGTGGWTSPTTAQETFVRFCSADLAKPSAFFNSATQLGYDGGRIFLNGEETAGGRAFAHFATGPQAGNTYELPWLGKLAHENVVANAFTGDRTVVATQDDGTNGQVYFYFGDKSSTGSDLQKAGLVGGHLWGIRVAEMTDEAPGNVASANPLGADNASAFTLVDLGDVSGESGSQLDADSEAKGVTSFFRPEDGAWDTLDHDRYYFVTTASMTQPSRLWAVDFNDASNPSGGGVIRLLLDGSEGQKMMDNITVDQLGHVIIQEDTGGDVHVAKVWDYDPAHDTMTMIAQHDPNRFDPSGSLFGVFGQDEESSGVVDVSDILGTPGQRAFLLDVQAHSQDPLSFPLGSDPAEIVEGGQLLFMRYDTII